MAMSDTAAEGRVAYLLDQLVSDGRDPIESVTLVYRAANNWIEVYLSAKAQRQPAEIEMTP